MDVFILWILSSELKQSKLILNVKLAKQREPVYF